LADDLSSKYVDNIGTGTTKDSRVHIGIEFFMDFLWILIHLGFPRIFFFINTRFEKNG